MGAALRKPRPPPEAAIWFAVNPLYGNSCTRYFHFLAGAGRISRPSTTSKSNTENHGPQHTPRPDCGPVEEIMMRSRRHAHSTAARHRCLHKEPAVPALLMRPRMDARRLAVVKINLSRFIYGPLELTSPHSHGERARVRGTDVSCDSKNISVYRSPLMNQQTKGTEDVLGPFLACATNGSERSRCAVCRRLSDPQRPK
jgi:hypothetical protein